MKNGCVAIGNTDMYYVSFGHGDRNLVVLPGFIGRTCNGQRESVIPESAL